MKKWKNLINCNFLSAMQKDIEDHVLRKHWKVITLHSLPPKKWPLSMVWSMKRKSNPLEEITKWKARLCTGGQKSIENVYYWATYSPVVSWITIRLILVLALINNWTIISIDFLMVFPQAAKKLIFTWNLQQCHPTSLFQTYQNLWTDLPMFTNSSITFMV